METTEGMETAAPEITSGENVQAEEAKVETEVKAAETEAVEAKAEMMRRNVAEEAIERKTESRHRQSEVVKELRSEQKREGDKKE